MFSSTVRSGISDSSWNTGRDAQRAARIWGLRGRYGSPSTRIVPVSGRNAPDRIWMNVLLPAPFSPSSACTSPARGVKLGAR